MFEILFANWGPPCRVLVDNISEWFSIFFLIYRRGFCATRKPSEVCAWLCRVERRQRRGLACKWFPSLLAQVFVQQTMRTAHEDEDLAYKQRPREEASFLQMKQAKGDRPLCQKGAVELSPFLSGR